MGGRWTLEERKRHLRQHYPERRRKWGTLIGLVAAMMLLSGAIGYVAKAQADVGLVFILVVALAVLAFVSIFALDVLFSEIW